jgi:DNA polymerase-3 subunit gamma/tau
MGDGDVSAARVREALGLVPEDEFLALLELIGDRRAGDLFAFVSRLADAGIDFSQFLTGFADVVRAQLAIVLGGTPPDVSDRVRDALGQRKDVFAAGDLLRMLNAITELEPRFRKSGQQQLLLEGLLVRFALLDRTVSLEALLRGMSGGGGASIDDTPAPRRAAPPPPPERVAAPKISVEPPPDRAAASKVSVEPPPAPRPVVQPAVPQGPSIPDVSHLAERWDQLAADLRAAGKSVAATALENSSPVAVNARGDVTIALDEANPIYEQALESTRTEIANLLRASFAGVQRITVRAVEGKAAPPTRLTDEMVRAERLASIRKKDPVLDRAIDALDLDLAD